MKKLMFIGSMLFVAMMMIATPAEAQSRKDKKAAKKADWEHQQKMEQMRRQHELDSMQRAMSRNLNAPDGDSYEIPCYSDSRSDKNYFRELGAAKSTAQDEARLDALDNANKMMEKRLSRTVKGLVTNYSKTVGKGDKGKDKESIDEGEYTSIVSGLLKDADNPCENRKYDDRTGVWNWYYVVEIEKNKVVEKTAEAISNNDKLRAEFDREKFRQFANDYMEGLKD